VVRKGSRSSRADQREVPPQLGALAEDDPDLPGDRLALALGGEAEHLHPPGAGVEDAGQHLDRGRLPRPVGPEAADHLPPGDGERDPVDGADLGGAPIEEVAQGGEGAPVVAGDLEGLA
jgi:hypothetical protein